MKYVLSVSVSFALFAIVFASPAFAQTEFEADLQANVRVESTTTSEESDTSIKDSETFRSEVEEARESLLERRRRLFSNFGSEKPAHIEEKTERQALTPEAGAQTREEARFNAANEPSNTSGQAPSMESGQATASMEMRINEERQTRLRSELDMRALARVKAYIIRITRRYHAAQNRLELLGERITSRVTKLKEHTDTTDAEVKIAEAYEALSAAEESIAEATGNLNNLLATNSPRDHLSVAEEHFTSAKTSLKAAQEKFIEAVQLLKIAEGRVEADTEADSEAGSESQADTAQQSVEIQAQ